MPQAIKDGRLIFRATTGKVQAGSRGWTPLSESDKAELLAVACLDDNVVGVLSHRLRRPPSEIRQQHVYVHAQAQEETRKRKQLAQKFLEKRKEISSKK